MCCSLLLVILSLYVKNKLNYSDDEATIMYHMSMVFSYFFPLFGAMLADSLFGRFKIILYFSIVFAVGQLTLAVSAIPAHGLPARY